MAGFAAESGEPVLQDAAAQILPELLFNVWWQSAAGGPDNPVICPKTTNDHFWLIVMGG